MRTVPFPELVDDGLLGDPRVDARIQAMGSRLNRANVQIEALEDQLVSVRAETLEAQAARAAAEREAKRARAISRPPRAPQEKIGASCVIDGVTRLAVNTTEAAQLLGVSVDFFTSHIALDLKCVRRGRRRLYAVRELESWLEQEGESVMPVG